MGIAAYNRGTAAIRRSITDEARPYEFALMDMLNSLPKYEDAGTPFGPIQFVFSHGGCWAECPKTGFGYWYPTLHEAVKRWRVLITEINGSGYVAMPN